MGGWFAVALGVVASVLFYRTGSTALMWATIAVTAVGFWSWGVMHNQAVEAAKTRRNYSGGFHDLTERDLAAVSERLALVNMMAMFVTVGLLITSIFFSL